MLGPRAYLFGQERVWWILSQVRKLRNISILRGSSDMYMQYRQRGVGIIEANQR